MNYEEAENIAKIMRQYRVFVTIYAAETFEHYFLKVFQINEEESEIILNNIGNCLKLLIDKGYITTEEAMLIRLQI